MLTMRSAGPQELSITRRFASVVAVPGPRFCNGRCGALWQDLALGRVARRGEVAGDSDRHEAERTGDLELAPESPPCQADYQATDRLVHAAHALHPTRHPSADARGAPCGFEARTAR